MDTRVCKTCNEVQNIKEFNFNNPYKHRTERCGTCKSCRDMKRKKEKTNDGDTKFVKTQYRGRTFQEIYDNNSGYCDWVMETWSEDEPFKQFLRQNPIHKTEPLEYWI
jgi:hypothetical protein